jgi:hypothetical protein
MNVPGCFIAAGVSVSSSRSSAWWSTTSWSRIASGRRPPPKATWKQASMRSSAELASMGAYTSRQKAV